MGAAHDLRGPLNNIVVNLELLKQSLRKANEPDARQPQHYIDHIQQEVHHLNRHVQILLDLVAPAKDSLNQIDLIQALAEIIEPIKVQARLQRVNLDIQLPEQAVHIHGRLGHLRQALLNIIINALEAMPNGGTLTVYATSRDHMMVIEIGDTGAGIPASLHERVFEIHYTSKNTGTGIGLPVARTIIHQHGGSILLRSNPGAGACFAITLPL